MDASQVFAYHAESEKLCAGKDRNYGGQKWKSRHAAFHAITGEDVKEDREPNNVQPNPIRLASCNGAVLKPVIISSAWRTSFVKV